MRLHFKTNIYAATLYQLVLSLLFLMATRLIFVVVNQGSVAVDSVGTFLSLSGHGLRFDLVAAAYFNALFILMRILPGRFTESGGYLRVTDWVYYVTNALMLMVSLGDTAYYRFSGTRLRWSGVQEVVSDPGAATLVGQYLVDYWWVVTALVVMVGALVWLYKRVVIIPLPLHRKKGAAARVAAFLLLGGLTFLAMRGRIGSGNPLNIADATWGASEAPQINVVLNTPFTLLRSIGKGEGVKRLTFFSDAEMGRLRTSVHQPSDSTGMMKKNVMIIIIESGGAIFSDSLRPMEFEGVEELRGLTPFIDSIAGKSLVVTNMLATGRRSNEGANAILGSFPAFEPLSYMLSPYNGKAFDSPGSLLKREGYSTTFYYGCNHGSFNIDQLAHASGLDRVIDRAGYTGPAGDYDGGWGIFDGPMGMFTAADLTKMSQPWFAAWFTITAHSPFRIPADEDLSGYRYKEATPMRGIEYTDRALRRFFAEASRQPWYDNTIFVITADHGSRDMPKGSAADSPYIMYHLPFVVFTPDGSVAPRRITDRAMAQFDIAPTLMGLLGYPHPYVAVGSDILDPSVEHYSISLIDNRYMITSPELVVFTDAGCTAVLEAYDATTDPALKHKLDSETAKESSAPMLRWAQALLQDYTDRINSGALAYQNM